MARRKIRNNLIHTKGDSSFKGTHRLELDHIMVIQQKRLSDKYSWNIYEPNQNLGSDAKLPTKYADSGRPYRFHYRINIYRKVFN